MNRLLLPLIALLAASPLPLQADPGGNAQQQARKELRAGTIRPPREIEGRVIPTMPGAQYLGFEYDPAALAYRLKFIRDGHVIFVDVDARTGETIRRTR